MEAMACGAALVSTDNGGVNDFAVDGESAVIVPVDDPKALSSAALRLLEGQIERDRLALAGSASVARFTWEASNKLFLQAALMAMNDSSS
jgi:glycosyltransferase involved in cell wall biosynthesis